MRLWPKANDETSFASFIIKLKDANQLEKKEKGDKVHAGEKKFRVSC